MDKPEDLFATSYNRVLNTEEKIQRRKLAAKLPELAKRVFNLDWKERERAGFSQHWKLHRALGQLLVQVNDYDRYYGIADLGVHTIWCEFLEEELDKAEKSLKNPPPTE